VRDGVAEVFRALADDRRRLLIETLARRESATPTELASELPVTRQAVAKHLTALGAAGLVRAERRGREARYRLTPEPLGEVVTWAQRVGAEWDARLEALSKHLESRA
jgi:DNA-binding transcriptional ArsR family regulator